MTKNINLMDETIKEIKNISKILDTAVSENTIISQAITHYNNYLESLNFEETAICKECGYETDKENISKCECGTEICHNCTATINDKEMCKECFNDHVIERNTRYY